MTSQTLALKEQTLPDLPYGYADLEPIISGEIMELHHSKHHAAYVTNFNKFAAEFNEAEAKGDLPKQIALFQGLRFNGGGHINHSIFWTNLAPKSKGGGKPPTGDLLNAIKTEWGSLESFIEKFNSQAGPLQGSGWGWLAYNKETKRLSIATCSNQDPLSTQGLVPLLGIDVWEHAYYLQYKNARPAYLKAIWEVVNWNNVSERFNRAKA